MSRHRFYRKPTNPATTEGWDRGKAALAALRKQGYGAGLTAATAHGRKGSLGSIYCSGADAREADEDGVLRLSFGCPEGTPDAGFTTTAAVGRAACAALTAAGSLWWWGGEGAYSILVNVAKSPADYLAAEQVKAAKALCDAAYKDAREARGEMTKAMKLRLEYWTATTLPKNDAPDVAYYQDGERAYAREAAACRAALAAYEVTMNPALPPAPALEWLGTCCVCGKVIAEDPCEKAVCGECQARIDGRKAVG
jgi:hypothetical protein